MLRTSSQGRKRAARYHVPTADNTNRPGAFDKDGKWSTFFLISPTSLYHPRKNDKFLKMVRTPPSANLSLNSTEKSEMGTVEKHRTNFAPTTFTDHLQDNHNHKQPNCKSPVFPILSDDSAGSTMFPTNVASWNSDTKHGKGLNFICSAPSASFEVAACALTTCAQEKSFGNRNPEPKQISASTGPHRCVLSKVSLKGEAEEFAPPLETKRPRGRPRKDRKALAKRENDQTELPFSRNGNPEIMRGNMQEETRVRLKRGRGRPKGSTKSAMVAHRNGVTESTSSQLHQNPAIHALSDANVPTHMQKSADVASPHQSFFPSERRRPGRPRKTLGTRVECVTMDRKRGPGRPRKVRKVRKLGQRFERPIETSQRETVHAEEGQLFPEQYHRFTHRKHFLKAADNAPMDRATAQRVYVRDRVTFTCVPPKPSKLIDSEQISIVEGKRKRRGNQLKG